MVSREKQKYTSCYCEENVWHLCNDRIGDDGKAIFISNDNRQCPMWHQRAAADGEPVIWDYHVIYLSRVEKEWMILDLDSTLELLTTHESLFYETNAVNSDLASPARNRSQGAAK